MTISNNKKYFLGYVFKILNHIEDIFIGIVLLGITLLITFNVFGRYIFGFSLSWAEELTRYLIIWLTFIGSSVCVRHKSHVGIDILLTQIPIEKKWILESVIAIIGIIFSIILTYYGWILAKTIFLSKQLSTAMMIPMYLVYIAIPIGGFLMSIMYFRKLLEKLRVIN